MAFDVEAFKKALKTICINSNVNIDLSSLEEAISNLTEVILQLGDDEDFVVKSLPPVEYCCEEKPGKYLSIICQKFQDNVLIESVPIY